MSTNFTNYTNLPVGRQVARRIVCGCHGLASSPCPRMKKSMGLKQAHGARRRIKCACTFSAASTFTVAPRNLRRNRGRSRQRDVPNLRPGGEKKNCHRKRPPAFVRPVLRAKTGAAGFGKLMTPGVSGTSCSCLTTTTKHRPIFVSRASRPRVSRPSWPRKWAIPRASRRSLRECPRHARAGCPRHDVSL